MHDITICMEILIKRGERKTKGDESKRESGRKESKQVLKISYSVKSLAFQSGSRGFKSRVGIEKIHLTIKDCKVGKILYF